MKDIEDRLKEEYDKVEVPDYMFDTSRVFKRIKKEKESSKKIVIASIASVVVIFMVAVLIILIPKNSKKDDAMIETKANNEKINIVGKLEINKNNGNNINLYNKEILVLTIKNVENEEYTILNKTPYTKIKAEVLNCHLGNAPGEIEMYVPGGTFKVKDIIEKIELNEEQLKELSKYNDDDFIQVTYYNEVYIPTAVINKTYVTTIYNINNDYFVDMNKAYGFKEYNPQTNIVNDDIGDVELEIDKYLENITK